MKILIYIPVYKRFTITNLCYTGLLRIINAAPKKISIKVYIVASNKGDSELAKSFGFTTALVANEPLGRKFNIGLSMALDEFDFDYVLQLNSDDLLATNFWDRIDPYLSTRLPYFGVDQLYFIDSGNMKVKHYKYPFGCGIRFIRRDVIEQAGFVDMDGVITFALWPDKINSGLDNSSDYNIGTRTNYAQRFIRTEENELPVVIDIKSDTNIHGFGEFITAPDVVGGDKDLVFSRFPELRLL